MSIWTSLFTGASGLAAHGDAISVVGDNIANASTVGYKSSRATFEDVLGGAAPNGQRLGEGVVMGGPDTNYLQGSLQQTGRDLDLAIRGNGFFAVSGSHNGLNSTYYTRAGGFSLDNTGTVVNAQGLKLQGYMIDQTTGAKAASASDLVIGGQSPPVATTKANLSVNLDASATPPAGGFSAANPAGTSNYSTSMTVYDSLGTAHRADVYFVANGSGSWDWHAMVDGGELTGGTPGTPTQIANGSLTFNTSGALQSQTTASSSASFVGAAASQAIAFNFGDDIASGGTGLKGTTDFAASSNVTAVDQDGHAAGTLTGVTVGDDGTITGSYSNGDTRAIAQVALASFNGQEGLERAGDQLFSQTVASGPPLVAAAGSGGRGSISGGSLESSNVDLGGELVSLIAYQRAFSANARTISTSDEMLQETMNLKR